MQLNSCIAFNAVCRDPPATTSHILRNLGLSYYEVRRFWKLIKTYVEKGRNSITLYRYKNISFKAELEVRSGAVCFVKPTMFIDEYECDELDHDSKLITNANILYMYVKGYVNNELFIKINVIYLLKKLFDLGEFNTVNSIKIISKKLINNSLTYNDMKHLGSLLRTLLKFSRELGELRIYIPKNETETLKLIPALTSKKTT